MARDRTTRARRSAARALAWSGIAVAAALCPACAGDNGSSPESPIPLFDGVPVFEAAGDPADVVSADFDGDGRADAAVAARSDAAVLVFLGDDDEVFDSPVGVDVGAAPTALAAMDLDGDGAVDLVVANSGADSFSVLRGDGDGGFPSRVDVTCGGAPADVAAADVDGDGLADVAVAIPANGTVAIFLARAGGALLPGEVLPAGSSPSRVAFADLDGDGAPDVIALDRAGGAVAAITNASPFEPAVFHPVGKSAADLATADVTLDGRPDVIVASESQSAILVLAGDGKGGLAQPIPYAAVAAPRSLVVGDLDGDSRPEVVLASPEALAILPNEGGEFGAVLLAPVGPGAVAVAIAVDAGDLDSLPDLVAVRSGSATLAHVENDGELEFSARRSFDAGLRPTSLAAGDVTGDGWIDVVAAAEGNGRVVILAGDSRGFFAPPQFAPDTGSPPSVVRLADLDEDDDLDLVTLSRATARLDLLFAVDGSLRFATSRSVGGATADFTVGDVDGDGIRDVVAGGGTEIAVLLGEGRGALGSATFFGGAGDVRAVAIEDFDNDGLPDVATADAARGAVSIFYGADDVIRAPITYAVGREPVSLAVVDRGGDPFLDLVVALAGDDAVAVLRNNGARNFTLVDVFPAGRRPAAIIARDASGDGAAELFVAASASDAVSVFVHDGDDTWRAPGAFATGGGPLAVVSGDFDDDLRVDIATADSLSNAITVLLGR